MLQKNISLKGRILFLLLLFISPYCLSKDTISWQVYHRPPGIIMIGEEHGQGFVQKMLQLIIDKMPEYEHKMPLTTLARAISDIKAGKQVCHPALFITQERLNYMYYSNATMVNPTNRVVARKGMFDEFLVNNSVDLALALKGKNLTFAVIKGRSYTESIDNMLTSYVDKSNLFEISNTDLRAVFRLIQLKRVDATIAYPFELGHFSRENDDSVEQLQTYSIKNVPQYTVGSIACPKNEWGKQVVTRVNAILAEIKSTPQYLEALTTWWEIERTNPEFMQFYQNEFLTH